MGIDIADLVKTSRHGMFKAGLIPVRLALMDRAAQQWGSPATPAEDLPDLKAEVAAGVWCRTSAPRRCATRCIRSSASRSRPLVCSG